MELRSASSAAHVHVVPAASLPTELGFHPIRQLARVQVSRVELRWQNVDDAVMAGVRAHWNQYGQRGVPFTYGPPGIVIDEGTYTYDSELQVTRNGARQIQMSVTVTQSLAYD